MFACRDRPGCGLHKRRRWGPANTGCGTRGTDPGSGWFLRPWCSGYLLPAVRPLWSRLTPPCCPCLAAAPGPRHRGLALPSPPEPEEDSWEDSVEHPFVPAGKVHVLQANISAQKDHPGLPVGSGDPQLSLGLGSPAGPQTRVGLSTGFGQLPEWTCPTAGFTLDVQPGPSVPAQPLVARATSVVSFAVRLPGDRGGRFTLCTSSSGTFSSLNRYFPRTGYLQHWAQHWDVEAQSCLLRDLAHSALCLQAHHAPPGQLGPSLQPLGLWSPSYSRVVRTVAVLRNPRPHCRLSAFQAEAALSGTFRHLYGSQGGLSSALQGARCRGGGGGAHSTSLPS